MDKPTPPDLSALVAAYETPTGTFDQDVVDTMRETVEERLTEFDELDLDPLVDQLLSTVAPQPPSSTTQTAVEIDDDLTIRIEGEGFVEVSRICDGWGDEPVADEANGTLSLNVNLTDLAVDPVVWASAESCRYRQETELIQMNAGTRSDVGDLRFFVGDNLTLGDLGGAPVLLEIDAEASVDGGVTFAAARFDLRLLPEDESVEVRVPVEDGDLIVRTVNDLIVTVRAQNGTFTCTEERICENEDGDVVEI